MGKEYYIFIKWGAPTPFRNQRTVKGCLAWQVAQEVSSGWGQEW